MEPSVPIRREWSSALPLLRIRACPSDRLLAVASTRNSLQPMPTAGFCSKRVAAFSFQ